MSTQVRHKPRKLPRQERSRATFEAIVTAGEQVLCRDGSECFRMNAVAERAGVSSGSLYQYFPNGQSLVQLIAERKLAKIHRRVVETLAQKRAAPAVDSMRAVLEAAVVSIASELSLMKELAKSEVFSCDSPVVLGSLGSLPRLFARCARQRPRGLCLAPSQLHEAFALVTQLVWETCLACLLEPERFSAARLRAELELLAREVLFTATPVIEDPQREGMARVWSEIRDASLGFPALLQMA